jgi:hypothetical protein
MKKLAFIAIIAMFALGACATAQLPATATPEAKKIAACQDAQMGYALSQAMLSQFVASPDALKYWTSYKAGAELALASYCQ